MSDFSFKSFISADESLPEITVRGLILAVLLIIILTAANAYLGLKMGTTIAASIPASIAAMGILSFFKNSNILEYNIVQTAASAGESIISGVGFILPAMILIHFWHGFNYWETALTCLCGGILGVIMSIPLRRILFAEKNLRFPEGTAIGHVLIAGSKNKKELKYLVQGGLIGSLISFAQSGLQVLKDSLIVWFKNPHGMLYGFALGYDPALFAAGYIIGVNVGLSMLLGVVIGWMVGIPVVSLLQHSPVTLSNASDIAISIWKNDIRYVGIGTMLVGGFWILVSLAKPLYDGLRASFASAKSLRQAGHDYRIRTDRDIPIHYSALCILLLAIPLCLLIYFFVNSPVLALSASLKLATVFIALIFILVVGFILATLSGYIAGLIGYTNSPTSALMLVALLSISAIILLLFNIQIHFNVNQILVAGGLSIIIASIVSTANCLCGETTQDLKAGQIVGATPWKQQVMLLLGVTIAAFSTPLILQLLFTAYGIGGVFPRPGMDPSQMLAAPQAALAATLVQATFSYQVPWGKISIGGIIAVFCIIIDRILKKRGTSLPTLAVGLGIYLPFEITIAIATGGIVSYFTNRVLNRRVTTEEKKSERQQRGLILACGLVAGAALMGVILAIPFAISQSTDILKIVPANFDTISNVLSFLIMIGMVSWVYYIVVKKKN